MNRRFVSHSVKRLNALSAPVLAVLLATGIAACAPLRAPLSQAPQELPAAASVEPVQAPAPPRAWTGAELVDMSLAEQLRAVVPPGRDQLALRRALSPDLPLPEPPTTPRAYEVGDRLEFWVHNSSTATNEQVSAELLHRTDHVYAWVAGNGSSSNRLIRRAVNRFSDVIYPAVTGLFGSEPNPGIDGDPRLHILFTTGMGYGVAGYFSGADTNAAAVVPHSNEKEMFYISLDWVEGMRDSEMVETVLAHEFQHMIHFNRDRNEEVWINEGLSEYAQEAAGYPPDTMFANLYALNPDTQLNTWAGSGGANGAHYGASYLFVRYLVQRFGEQIAGELVSEQANGIEGVRAVLEPYGATFEEIYADWLVANALDAGAAALGEGRYGYAALDPNAAWTGSSHADYPVREERAEVANFAADYIELTADEAMTVRLDIQGATGATIASGVQPPADGAEANRFFWSGRTDDSEARLSTTIDLSSLPVGSPATLDVRTWWEIEEDYDFGYVLASADGVTWRHLASESMTEANPTGNNLGVGLTRSSNSTDGGWVTERFDLSPFSGAPVQLRFSYVTDDAVNEAGWLIDEVRVDAVGYVEQFSADAPGWTSEGWLLTDGLLEQRWMVQVIERTGETPTAVRSLELDDSGAGALEIALDAERSALVAISALAEGTTLPALYSYSIGVVE
jgi:hypothetical protein